MLLAITSQHSKGWTHNPWVAGSNPAGPTTRAVSKEPLFFFMQVIDIPAKQENIKTMLLNHSLIYGFSGRNLTPSIRNAEEYTDAKPLLQSSAFFGNAELRNIYTFKL